MGLGNFIRNQGAGGLSSYLSQLTDPTNPLGQIGKAVSQASGGAWGDALSLLDQQKRQKQQDDMQQQIQQAQLAAAQQKQNRGQFLQLPNGAVAFGDPDTGQLQNVRNADPAQTHDPASVQAYNFWKELPQNERSDFRTFATGFGNTDEGQAQARGMADYRAGVARATKLAPTYGALHPSGGGGSRFGHTKANPQPIKGEGDLANVPVGTWVSPAPGVVFQVR